MTTQIAGSGAITTAALRVVLCVRLFALIPLAMNVPALATLAGVNALLWAMIAYETATYDERRWRLRHGLEVDPPGGERTDR